MSRRPVDPKVAAAYDLGEKARQEGRRAVPALDGELSKLLDGVPLGGGEPILRAWVKGWTREHFRITSD